MGAQWAGFMVCQLIALVRWRRASYWLVVVAGVRLCDAFTDLVYGLLAHDTTWFVKATLPAMGPIHVLMGWYLIRAWKRLEGKA